MVSNSPVLLTDQEITHSKTESVCPVCLKRINATRIFREDGLYLHKTCLEHGLFETPVWRGVYESLPPDIERIPAYPESPITTVQQGCPFDCGLCSEHRQQPCCVLLEVTRRCDLTCPICYASAGNGSESRSATDPDLYAIKTWYETLLRAGGPFNIQLSGGEPCMRDDLAEIISLGRVMGFTFFQVNTNGLRIGRDISYLSDLKKAGLSTVYLQFDGTTDEIYQRIRGRKLLEQKIAAIENCRKLNIGVVLVPTIKPGVNDHVIGEIIRFALSYHPAVRGVHFQPISYFGRYPVEPANSDRITLPEVISAIHRQTNGQIHKDWFTSSAGPNRFCSFNCNFVVMEDGSLKPIIKRQDAPGNSQIQEASRERVRAQAFVARNWPAPEIEPGDNKPVGKPALGGWDSFLSRAKTHLFAISGMAFQDAWTLDLDRLRDCYIMVVSPDNRLIPFCAYNLTDRMGNSIYRKNPEIKMNITPLEKWISQKIGGSTESLSRYAVEAYQLERINSILDYAKKNSPFYRDAFSGVSLPILSFQEFSAIPFTTSDDLRNDPVKFVCVSQNEISRIVTLSTSGTTGQPKRCFFTPNDQELTIDFFGAGMSTLISAGDRVLILLPDRTPGSVGDLLFRGLEHIGVLPFKHGPVTDLDETLKTMHQLNINCLVGAPVQILALVRYQQLKPEIYPVNMKSILLSTDYLPESIMSVIQSAWHCEVFNHYGTTEMGLGGGVFCEAHYGFHLREADLYFEIVDPQTGLPQADGEMGEVIFTTLTRRGMPLIRYKTGDYSRFLVSPCPCGTSLKSLEKINGRVNQHFAVNGKKYLIGQFDEALFSLQGLINYQLQVHHGKETDQLVFTVYFISPVAQNLMSTLLSALSEHGIQLDADAISINMINGYPQELWLLRKRTVLEEYT